MEHLGVGDRWLEGEAVEGVRFGHKQPVEIVGGSRDGQRGRILLLIALEPEPTYLVMLEIGAELRVRQSALAPLPSS
jgi:hypothetical protein